MFRLPDLLTPRAGLTFLIYVVLGPFLGLVSFMEVIGRIRWQDLPLAYLAGGGPALLCFLAMLRLAGTVRHRGMRFILSPAIGAASGAFGCLPFAFWWSGLSLGGGRRRGHPVCRHRLDRAQRCCRCRMHRPDRSHRCRVPEHHRRTAGVTSPCLTPCSRSPTD